MPLDPTADRLGGAILPPSAGLLVMLSSEAQAVGACARRSAVSRFVLPSCAPSSSSSSAHSLRVRTGDHHADKSGLSSSNEFWEFASLTTAPSRLLPPGPFLSLGSSLPHDSVALSPTPPPVQSHPRLPTHARVMRANYFPQLLRSPEPAPSSQKTGDGGKQQQAEAFKPQRPRGPVKPPVPNLLKLRARPRKPVISFHARKLLLLRCS